MVMRRRTRILDSLAAHRLFVADFGEDWVVPKAPLRYVVLSAVGNAALLTAFGPDGLLLGERLFPDPRRAAYLLDRLAADGMAEPPRDLPPPPESATRALDRSPP